MELTEKQKEGLKIAVDRYNKGCSYTVIAGYAGTGKSTLINHIIAALGINPNEVAYIALTGKAAEVLRRKGCPNACTAHRLLYTAKKNINGEFIFEPKLELEDYSLIVVDEVSMLPKKEWDLLLSHNIPVLACGDPGQLPPINKDDAIDVLDNPHIFLDEVMRQAQDNEIIRLSMDIREGKPLRYFKGKDVQIIPQSEVVEGMYTWADQILVATNARRAEVNDQMRTMLGKFGAPKVGDKIISLENHWDIIDAAGNSALVNGTIGYIDSCEYTKVTYPIRPKFIIGPINAYEFNIKNEIGEQYSSVLVDKKYIEEGKKTLSDKQSYWIYKYRRSLPATPIQIDYGYAITVHRAQGSEWDKILIFEERFPFDKEEHRRWLYTAVTRASGKIVLVR